MAAVVTFGAGCGVVGVGLIGLAVADAFAQAGRELDRQLADWKSVTRG